MRYVNGSIVGLVFFLVAAVAMAGDLDSPAGPSDSGSAMYTLEDVYNRINDGTEGTKRSGSFTEPSAGPASTGHDLDDLYDLASKRSRPAKTGQTPTVPLNPAPAGSDGNLQKGVTWPSPRFTDNSNGTVTDNLTGLVWLKNANCYGTRNWATALTDCNGLNHGVCGLSDGSSEGDWRLPNRFELESTLDMSRYNPALPSGHPFTGVQSYYYWSSTTYVNATEYAWIVDLIAGFVSNHDKSYSRYVWPVRGGQ